MGMHLIGICLMGVYLIGAYLMGVHFNGRASHLRVFLARMTWVARIPIFDTKDVFEASELWATRPSGCWSPLERAPRGEKLPKDCLTAEVLLEAKAAALHPERYQSLLSKLSTKREGEAGKEAQAMGLASQSDGQTGDRQTG
jgi:hypothetical protein